MISRLLTGSLRLGLATGLLAAPPWALAQNPPAAVDWRTANDGVGQFRRGHADVLRWEQSRQILDSGQAAVLPGLQLASAADAVRLAWQAHRELVHPLARLAPDDVERIASGRWLELDPALSVRIEHFDDLIEVAAQARKAWIEAVASQLIAARMAQSQAAAQLADELGARMVSVGNWSRLQQAQVQLARHSADADLRRARYQAVQAQASLIQRLQLNGIHAAVGLPDQLPELPEQSLSPGQIQQHLARSQAWLPQAERMKQLASAVVAPEAYLASHAIALSAREAHKVSTLLTEETQLHYNGMLKSSWDLLSAAQNQFRAAATALAAQRDFELAQVDLQWLLLGGDPGSFMSLGAGGANPAAAAGH